VWSFGVGSPSGGSRDPRRHTACFHPCGDPSSIGDEVVTTFLTYPEIKRCQFDVVDTTKEDGNHGHLEAQKSTLHPRETPV
jgi:hypothetical protein